MGIVERLLVMSAHIKIHLASEDRLLYPKLATSNDSGVSVMANQYQAEMGGLSAALRDFVERWRIADWVASDPEGFRAASNQVLRALHDVVRRPSSSPDGGAFGGLGA